MTATPQLMLNRKQKRLYFHAKMTVHWQGTHGAGHIALRYFLLTILDEMLCVLQMDFLTIFHFLYQTL